MIYVYAIKSKERRYLYVGLTNDVERRVNQHQKGYEKTTRPYRPFRLILCETYPDRAEARIREKYLKTAAGKRFLYSLV
jgi:putative endonuclease